MEKLPSTKQMLHRMNSGHAALLRAFADDTDVAGAATATAGTIRGYRTCRSTLHRWGCLESTYNPNPTNGGRAYATSITERGRDLLDAWDRQQQA